MTRERVVVATSNPGKLRELLELLHSVPMELLSQSQLGVTPVDETGATFLANALLKAQHAARATGLASIADDSGLEVDALDGAPGIYSARYAGAHASEADNNAKLIAALRDVAARSRAARYRCAIVFFRNPRDESPLIAEGCWEGEIIDTPRGSHGFGYDPHFWLASFGKTAAELPAAEKNRISHRGQALRQLRERLQELR